VSVVLLAASFVLFAAIGAFVSRRSRYAA
jgi:hypothetical protein